MAQKTLTSPLRKKKLSDFIGVLGGDEFEDFEKAALEARRFGNIMRSDNLWNQKLKNS